MDTQQHVVTRVSHTWPFFIFLAQDSQVRSLPVPPVPPEALTTGTKHDEQELIIYTLAWQELFKHSCFGARINYNKLNIQFLGLEWQEFKDDVGSDLKAWQKVAESGSECFKGRSVTGDASA